MTEATEGMLIASHCMFLALLRTLVLEGALPPNKMRDLMGTAEETLAGLSPELMSVSARENARVILQECGKI